MKLALSPSSTVVMKFGHFEIIKGFGFVLPKAKENPLVRKKIVLIPPGFNETDEVRLFIGDKSGSVPSIVGPFVESVSQFDIFW
jgi:hypothetical protein